MLTWDLFDASGVPAICRPTGTPITSVRVVVNAGSLHEKVPGTAHFLEHMFFKGSTLRGYEEVNRLAARLGNTNAYTCASRTVFLIETTQDKVSEALDLLLEMLLMPRLDPAEMEKERGVILEEWRAGQDDPVGYLLHQAMSKVVPGPNGRPVIGTDESIKAITVQDLRDFQAANYTRQNLAIAIIGGTSRLDRSVVTKLVDKYDSLIPNGVRNEVPNTKMAFGGWDNPPQFQLTHAAEQAGLTLWMPWVSMQEDLKTNFASMVLTNMLGEGMHSMLFDRLREKSGLCYATGAGVMGSWDDGALMAYALLAPENVAQGLKEMQAVLMDVAQGHFDDDLLQVSLANCLFSLASSVEKASGWAYQFIDNFFYYVKVGLVPVVFQGFDFYFERLNMNGDQLRANIIKVARKMVSEAVVVTMNAQEPGNG